MNGVANGDPMLEMYISVGNLSLDCGRNAKKERYKDLEKVA